MPGSAQPVAEPTAHQLYATLVDYASAPGKYQLTLRQPSILFNSIREVLQIAAGRDADGTPAGTEVRDAAGFFLRAALLYPGADHYAVLGLPPRSEPVELKERYRLLMRLIHPDYANTRAAPWPADAAVRVNRAYQVLSSPVQRRHYDEQLRAAGGLGTVAGAVWNKGRNSRAHGPKPTRIRQQWRVAWALGIGAGVFIVWAIMPAHDSVQLVQKEAMPRRAPSTQVVPPQRTESERPPAAPGTGHVPDRPTAASVAPAGPPDAAPPAHQSTAQHVGSRPGEPLASAADTNKPSTTMAVATPLLERPAQPLRPVPDAPAAAAPMAAITPPISPTKSDSGAAAPLPLRPEPGKNVAQVSAKQPAPVLPVAPSNAPGPTLNEVQPLLTQLLQTLESGSAEQVLRMLDADARQAPSAQMLSRHYEQLIRGARPVRLTHVDFSGEPHDGVLLVTGRVRLHAGETTIGSLGERFLVRAEFASRGGKVTLTSLGGGTE